LIQDISLDIKQNK